MKKYILTAFLCFLFLFCQVLFSQEKTEHLNKLESLLSKNKLQEINLDLIKQLNKDTIHFKDSLKAKTYRLLAKYYEKNDKEEIAFQYLKRASQLYLNDKNYDTLTDVYFNIAKLLNRRTNLKKDATEYVDKIYNFAIENHDKKLLSKAYYGYALLFMNEKDYKKALRYYKKTLTLNKDQTENLAKSFNNIAVIYSSFLKEQDSARYYYKKSRDLYKKLKHNREAFATSLNLGITYKEEKNYPKTLEWLQKADSIPLSKYRKNYKRILYRHFADTYEKLHDYKNAFHYLKLRNAYKDSLNIEKQTLAIADMETKYKSVQKEKENIQLKAEKKQQQYFIWGTLGVTISIIIFSLMLYRNLKRKEEVLQKEKEIQLQKAATLVKEQEILAMNAMYKGQEKERLRLAAELHDNLGSSLATLKMQFDSFKNTAEKENSKQFSAIKRVSRLLDETYQKVRYMAHTNHVSVMEKQGLIHSLKLFTQKLSDAKDLTVEFNYFGFDKQKLNTSLELNAFRIIQEILTNIIKHANATKISIDINLFDDVLSILIEDNGVGFNTKETLKKKKTGMGLQNLMDRVLRENGNFSIDSQIGKGTTIVIEIPIMNVKFKEL